MLNLQICPNCGELYDTSTYCASDKCTARYAIEWLEQITRAAKIEPINRDKEERS